VDYAIEQAKAFSASMTVVNTGRDGDYADAVFATAEDVDAPDSQLGAAGIEHEIVRPTDGTSAADSLLGADCPVVAVKAKR
jgi:hypothetical protein